MHRSRRASSTRTRPDAGVPSLAECLACLLALLLTGCGPGRPTGADTETPARRAEEAAQPAPNDDTPVPRASRELDFQAPDARGRGRAAGLIFLERVTGGADADSALPMVVFVHGLGDRARDVWLPPNAPPLRLVMPQAPTPHGRGYSWFPYRMRDERPDELARGIDAAVDRLAKTIEVLAGARPTLGKAIVAGFSQGGMLSWAVALRHPARVAAAFPVAGMLPRPLWPEVADPEVPPIHALHGDADPVVPLAPDRALAEHLAGLGLPVTLEVFPGARHELRADMADRLQQAIYAAVETQRAATPPPPVTGGPLPTPAAR